MFERFRQFFYALFCSKPVTWDDVCTLVSELDTIDVKISELRQKQKYIDNLEEYFHTENEIYDLIQKRSLLSRKKAKALKTAKKTILKTASDGRYEKVV
jgi:hypothetical protein